MDDKRFEQKDIEAYLLGQLGSEKRQIFEQQMLESETLRQGVEKQKELQEAVEYYGVKELKKELQIIHQDLASKDALAKPSHTKQQAKVMSWRWWLAAALITGVSVLAYLFWPQPSYSAQELYAVYYEQYPVSLDIRDVTVDSRRYTQAIADYQTGSFASAFDAFSALLQADPNNNTYLLGSGICLLELNQAEEALSYFKRMLQTGDVLLRDQARWYAALAHLQQNEPEQARTMLLLLSADSGADHHQEARSLLQQLE